MSNYLNIYYDKIFYMKRIFADRLKELRKEQNLSFVELSKVTGLSRSELCRWENGQADITSDNLIILAKYFKVSADYLLGLED